MVIDLSRVAFMDASTLGAIFAARNRLRGQGRSVCLRAPSPGRFEFSTAAGSSELIDGFGDPAV